MANCRLVQSTLTDTTRTKTNISSQTTTEAQETFCLRPKISKVEMCSTVIVFHAKLRGRHGYEDRNVNLNINIENDDGRFKFVKQYVSDWAS